MGVEWEITDQTRVYAKKNKTCCFIVYIKTNTSAGRF